MTFSQAKALSKTSKLHVRRKSWTADKWFMLWRGTWFCFGTSIVIPRPVRAADYSADDLRATDWTSVPAPLASCPVTPGEPSGGGDPTGGSGGIPDLPDIPYPASPGTPGGGGGPPSLPPPDGGSSIRVRFALLYVDPAGTYIRFNPLTDTGISGWPVPSIGANHWHSDVIQGQNQFTNEPLSWVIDVTRSGLYYSISLHSAAGGFSGDPGLRREWILNTISEGEVYGGYAEIR